MATTKIIRFYRDDLPQSDIIDKDCSRVPHMELVYDTDGPLRKYGKIMHITPASDIVYVQIAIKASVHVDVSMGGEQTVDRKSLVDGDLVWLANQLNPTTNGIYMVRPDSWEFHMAVTENVLVDFGATSVDPIDGDITRGIVTDKSQLTPDTRGFYSIIYYSLNSFGILNSIIRKVAVIPDMSGISPVPGYSISNYCIGTETINLTNI